MNKSKNKNWDQIIKPKTSLFDLRLNELWHYRDLIMLFVRRDFVSVYKQTILGPLWYILKPLLTTIVFTIIFNKFAKIPTDNLPPMLFYMAGTISWSYFASCLKNTSTTFLTNENIFGKVYFPRLVIPVSVAISNLIAFAIQLLFFICFIAFYAYNGFSVNISWSLLIIPYFLLLMAALGLGFGIIVSSLTTKYRDLAYLVEFGIQLFMYASPVIYSVSGLPEKYQHLIMLNPMSSVIEGFRYSLLGTGIFNFYNILYSTIFALIILIIGILLFNKVEKTFMDTV